MTNSNMVSFLTSRKKAELYKRVFAYCGIEWFSTEYGDNILFIWEKDIDPIEKIEAIIKLAEYKED